MQGTVICQSFINSGYSEITLIQNKKLKLNKIAITDYPSMTSSSPYIARRETTNFLNAFSKAVENPKTEPTLFHVWGMGGVGKSTLLNKLKEKHPKVEFARVYFGNTPDIDTPLKLMAKLYNKLPQPGLFKKDLLAKDTFKPLYNKYQQALKKLGSEPEEGKEAVDKEQLDKVKNLANLGIRAFSFFTGGDSVISPKMAETAIDGVASALSVKDDLLDMLKKHSATREDQQLQELLL